MIVPLFQFLDNLCMALNVFWKCLAQMHMVGTGSRCHPHVLPTTDGSVIVRPVTKQTCFLCHRACASVVRERTCQEQWKFHFCNCCIIVLWSGWYRSVALLLRGRLHLVYNTSLHDLSCFWVFFSWKDKKIAAGGKGSDRNGRQTKKKMNFFSTTPAVRAVNSRHNGTCLGT